MPSVLRIDERQFIMERIAVGEFGDEVGALIEADEKEIIIVMARLNEGFERLARDRATPFILPGDIERDAEADRHVFVLEVPDRLFDLILKDLEVLFVETAHEKAKDRSPSPSASRPGVFTLMIGP